MGYLECDRISKRFGGKVAIRDLSFDINRGEIVGMIGPNGSGKTTVFNLITGYYSPDRGTIRFRGENITNLKPHQICRIGIARTFQQVKPLVNMSVFDNVLTGAFCKAKNRRDAEEIAHQTLGFIGLSEKKNVLSRDLTYAEKRKLEIARALATSPEILLFDETMAGLNSKEIGDAVLLIQKTRDRGMTIVLIEHVMQSITSLSDRVIVLSHGEKIAEGTPQEISKNPKVVESYLGREYVFA